MTELDSLHSPKTEPAGMFNTLVNILTSPAEAFNELNQRPSKLFPLLLILIANVIVLSWYFTIIDFDWFIDDTLGGGNFDLSEEQLESAREVMQSMSQTRFRMFGIFGGSIGLLVIYALQAGYLGLASALNGDRYKFTHWFSLICWTGLPYLLSIIGMAVTIALSPNGQLSQYTLDPLTLANLGMQSSNGLIQTAFNSLSLTMIWSIALVVMAYKQWLQSGLGKALIIVLAPYLIIFSALAYFALA